MSITSDDKPSNLLTALINPLSTTAKLSARCSDTRPCPGQGGAESSATYLGVTPADELMSSTKALAAADNGRGPRAELCADLLLLLLALAQSLSLSTLMADGIAGLGGSPGSTLYSVLTYVSSTGLTR